MRMEEVGTREPEQAGPEASPTDAADAMERAASDARVERMDRVALLYSEITAATRVFLSALAESDRHGDWSAEGFRSCAEWLAWRIGICRGTANEKVRVARALEGLPATSAAMARGSLSFSKVRALTRVATPDSETELLAYARSCSAARLERFVREWRTIEDREAEQRLEHRQWQSRSFSIVPDHDGTYVLRGRLPPEIGAVLMRAVEAASDALYRDGASREAAGANPRAVAPAAPHPEELDELTRREAARRRADALGLIAERALAAGLTGDHAPISGARAERYQVMLHVDAHALTAVSENGPVPSRRPHLDDGMPVSAETARRLACDAALVEIRRDTGARAHAPNGTGPADPGGSTGSTHDAPVDVGRRTRTVPPALRRALEIRDRGCRFPACASRFTDAHHIVHWADGGPTRLDNLILLCRRHHRAVHEQRVRVAMGTDRSVVFFTPDGRTLADAPPLNPAPPLDPSRPSTLDHRRTVRGSPDALTPTAAHDRFVPWHLEAAAWNALDPPARASP